jgi:hypothetical protein
MRARSLSSRRNPYAFGVGAHILVGFHSSAHVFRGRCVLKSKRSPFMARRSRCRWQAPMSVIRSSTVRLHPSPPALGTYFADVGEVCRRNASGTCQLSPSFRPFGPFLSSRAGGLTQHPGSQPEMARVHGRAQAVSSRTARSRMSAPPYLLMMWTHVVVDLELECR